MAGPRKKNKLWALLGVLTFLLFNYPLLHIVNRDLLVWGLPLLLLYLFAAWIGAIGGLFALSRLQEPGDRETR